MKANQINAIAKDIRVNRQKFESIVNEFRAYWGKVYRHEVTEELNKVVEALKNDAKNVELKNKRYGLEQVCAKIKGMTLTDEISALIKQMHDEDKLTFACLTTDFIVNGLAGTKFVTEDGIICERKRIKGTEDFEYKPIEKWTESKVGRYFRMAVIGKVESK